MNEKETQFFEHEGLVYQRTIASGAYGVLYLVFSNRYQTFFALKKVPEQEFNQAEIDCLKSLDQCNIVNLYKYYHFDDYVYLLMEFCPNDLASILKQNEGLAEDQLLKYAHDILIAIKACHDLNIAHNDIKPSNFLVDKYGRIKMCDFGLSRMYDENCMSSSYKGTMLFMAPELFKKTPYNPMKADIWSIGVTLFFLATNTYPFFAQDRQVFLKTLNTGSFPSFLVHNKHLRMIVNACLQVNPDDRPTIDELLAMPYFESYINHANRCKDGIKMACSQNILNLPPMYSRLNKLSAGRCSCVPVRKPPLHVLVNINKNSTM